MERNIDDSWRGISAAVERMVTAADQMIDDPICFYQGKSERGSLRIPCTYGEPDDGDLPSAAYDGTKNKQRKDPVH